MHRVSYLVIENFRACRNVSLPLEGYTPLVGLNNAGKSTILRAIEWVLKPKSLQAGDFFDLKRPVSVSACIDGISNEVLDRIPEPKHRRAIEPYCRNGKIWVRVTATGTGTNSVQKEVWDIDQCQDDGLPDRWRGYPTGLPQAVSVLLPEPLVVQAMHDLNEDLGKAKAGTTIKELLDEIMGPLLAAHADLNKALETIRQVLTVGGARRSEHLQRFDSDVTSTLAHFFPGLELDLDLQVVGAKDFIKAGDLQVTDAVTGDRRRFDQVGTGAQRAIQIALIRYLAESRKDGDSRVSRRLLLIDEPELYLHPQGVRRLRQALASLSASGFQVVFSTHSPLMLSRENAADTVIVDKRDGAGVITQRPLRKAVEVAIKNAESQSRTVFELSNLVDIYFSRRVVICEGKTDRRLLPLAYERVYGHPPEIDHTAFVSIGSCSDIPRALPVLMSMGITACAIADLDFAYTHARSGGLLPRDGQDLTAVKLVLRRLQGEHGFPLHDNGLPVNDRRGGWLAADVWALFAADDQGKVLAKAAQGDLLKHGTWIWQQGCIEQVTGAVDKGEDAILEQEEKIGAMSSDDINNQMPYFKMCFDWIRGL